MSQLLLLPAHLQQTAFARMIAFLEAEGIDFAPYLIDPHAPFIDLAPVAACFNADGSFLYWSNH